MLYEFICYIDNMLYEFICYIDNMLYEFICYIDSMLYGFICYIDNLLYEFIYYIDNRLYWLNFLKGCIITKHWFCTSYSIMFHVELKRMFSILYFWLYFNFYIVSGFYQLLLNQLIIFYLLHKVFRNY